jgi:glucose/arabinose dehydrogenase
VIRFSSSRVISPRRRTWQRVAAVLMLMPFLLSLFGTTHTYAISSIQSSSNTPEAVSWPLLRFQSIANGFSSPIDVVSANDGTNRLFVLEQEGLIYIIENGVRLPTPFLDISDRLTICNECGLLGLAFPPNFAEEGYFFVDYTSKADLVGPDTGDNEADDIGDTVIARFHVTGNPNVADSVNEERILVINQPAANHNGGHILFGPDDYLYIGMGDGGIGGDHFQNAQDPASLHGKILRIAVSGTNTYTVPADNPFVNTQGYRDEIWAMGLRNPWRFDFDRVTGDLYIADVGQGNIEEVNHVAAAEIGNGGMNFGWPILEGNDCYPPDGPKDCRRTGLITPVTTYTHELGDCSVTGGYVYDSELPNQGPVYLFADYCSGRIWGLQPDGNSWAVAELADFGFQITSFGEDGDGNVYLVSYSGTIYHIVDPATSSFIPSLSKAD